MDRFNEIISGEGLTLVDFFATWCGPCQTMHPVLEQLKKELGEGIRIIKTDIDRNGPLANRNGIDVVPTLLLFRQGEVIWRQSGAMGLEALKAQISQFM